MEDTQQSLDTELSELKEKYIRLAADFDNYKKRSQNEKISIKSDTSLEWASSIMDLDNDLSIMISNEANDDIKNALNYSKNRIIKFLGSKGIKPIELTEYNPEIHEVVSVIQSDKTYIETVTNGYIMNEKIIRYPKVILFTNK